ncbi:MAG: M48 family metallopeptidase [Minwuia sp.]|uniref:M48 family metallopeptidase n=1 Tax=Minwuia sp. TaxID=2493630 RepID=UPI003A8BA647
MSESLPPDLRVLRHPRARRMKLRLDRADGAPVLVLPPRASLAAGEAFVLDHLDWIAERRDARPKRRPFGDGVSLPVLDDTLTVAHRPGERSGVRRDGALLLVSGEAAHINRRVTDWLKAEARRELGHCARGHAADVGVKIARIRIADQKSRWGSCSSSGALSFNWRLILAPAFVLDFVAAHEVAHMREMNHGPAFHRLVARLHPQVRQAEVWLRDNGPDLRAWG